MESELPNEDNDFLSNIKTKRSIFQFEMSKKKRDAGISEKRARNFLNNILENDEIKAIIDSMHVFLSELQDNTKLKSTQHKFGKGIMVKLRKLYKENSAIFKEIVEANVFLSIASILLGSENYTTDIKHEVLWIISLASSCSLKIECALSFIQAVVSSINYLNPNLPKTHQLIFYQKIAYIITNLIIENATLLSHFPENHQIQLLIIVLIDSTDLENMLIGLWLLRNLAIKRFSGMPDVLSNFSIQNSLLSIIKSNTQNKNILQETIWTIAYLTQINYDYEILSFEFLEILLDCGIYFPEFILPCITIMGNSIQFLQESTIKKFLNNLKLQDFVKLSLGSNNFLIKREILFMISNLCGRSEEISENLIQKEDLLSDLLDISIKKESYLYREAIIIISMICNSEKLHNLEYLSSKYYEKISMLKLSLEDQKNSVGLHSQFEIDLYNVLTPLSIGNA